MSDFHIVVFFFILLYTNRSFFDETETEQIQIQTCGNSTNYAMVMFVMAVYVSIFHKHICTARSFSFQFTIPIFYATVLEVDNCKGQLAHK